MRAFDLSPSRRSFLVGCGCVVAATALAPLAAAASAADGGRPTAVTAAALATENAAQLSQHDGVAFYIDGWQSTGDAHDPADARPWIRLDASWRAAWH